MTSTTMTGQTGTRRAVGRFLRNQSGVLIIWAILIALIIFASFASDRFLTPFNRGRVVAQMTTLALLAIGQTFVLLTAGIDLSVGSVVSLVGTIMVAFAGESPLSWLVGVVVALGASGFVGLVNGLAVTRLRVSPFMATLATLSIVQGVALVVSDIQSGTLPREFGTIFTGELTLFTPPGAEDPFAIPIPLILMVVATLVAAFVLRQTPFGRHVYAVGSNEVATRLSGMATDRIKLMAYVISGLMAGLAGVYNAARTLSGDPLVGAGLEFDAITAVVLGGVSLFGGRGSVLGALAGVAIIAVLRNMLNLMRIESDYQYVVRGALLILAVMVYNINWRNRKLWQKRISSVLTPARRS